MDITKIKTLGELKKEGYHNKSVKEEIRANLIRKLRKKETTFPGILGYEDSVIPDTERALLSRHNILFLGLRGQAKTRMARQMTELLDEYVPFVTGSEVNDNPFAPITKFSRDLLASRGDDTPISWLHRSERYGEKLATPDVSVADLIGDIDPIKAANLRLNFADEEVIHFGIIPKSNRGIFVINEIPDLQARIQVSLFNILEEGDIQIRGFKLRMPLDMLFVFTANPEDYTNRGSIVTPLKDRIESQILTHYPRTLDISRQITQQEASLSADQRNSIEADGLVKDLVEQIAFEARNSEYVDKKSGVSARLTISAYENLVSNAERRMLINHENATFVRVADFLGVIPAITGKIELVYEGELEGPGKVANILIGKAIKTLMIQFFPDPEKAKKAKAPNPYAEIINWFGDGNNLSVIDELPQQEYKKALNSVSGLKALVKKFH